MTVKELINQLSQFDPNLLVVTDGQELGYNDIEEVSQIELGKYEHDMDWCGEYEKKDQPHHSCPFISFVTAVNISRYVKCDF